MSPYACSTEVCPGGFIDPPPRRMGRALSPATVPPDEDRQEAVACGTRKPHASKAEALGQKKTGARSQQGEAREVPLSGVSRASRASRRAAHKGRPVLA